MGVFVPPMRAVAGDLPAGDGWTGEIKWDGMRLQAHCQVNSVQAFSTSGRDVTSSFPELEPLSSHLGTSAILDTEAVVFDRQGPSFHDLQSRMHVSNPTDSLLAEHPVTIMVFDVLELDGRTVTALPYLQRRHLLTQLLDDGPTWRVPAHSEGDLASLFQLAAKRGLEGIMAKRSQSLYLVGSRSRDWIKVKNRKVQEFVIGGWVPGKGSLVDSIGSLAVGVYEPDGKLKFAGVVGSGLDNSTRKLLSSSLVEGPCPFAGQIDPPVRSATWVEPTQVAQVEFSSWEPGHRLRHPVFQGLRLDKSPTEVVREN